MKQAYDRDRLVELFGGDADALAEIEQEFLDTARGVYQEIRDTEDFEAIARAAHRLKGAAGMIGATMLCAITDALERAARGCDLAGVRRLEDSFAREVATVATQVGAGQARGRSITVAE